MTELLIKNTIQGTTTAGPQPEDIEPSGSLLDLERISERYGKNTLEEKDLTELQTTIHRSYPQPGRPPLAPAPSKS